MITESFTSNYSKYRFDLSKKLQEIKPDIFMFHQQNNQFQITAETGFTVNDINNINILLDQYDALTIISNKTQVKADLVDTIVFVVDGYSEFTYEICLANNPTVILYSGAVVTPDTGLEFSTDNNVAYLLKVYHDNLSGFMEFIAYE